MFWLTHDVDLLLTPLDSFVFRLETLVSLSLAVSTNGFLALTGSFVSSADGGPLSAVEVLSDQAFAKKGPISNRGKKKEVFLDDVVGIAALRTPSTLGTSPLCGTKGKRSEREKNKDTSTINALSKS